MSPRHLVWTSVGLPLLALAQGGAPAGSQPPAGSPSDVRYTATTAGLATLYPRAPGQDEAKPSLLRGDDVAGTYGSNAAVGRIVVEVNRNAVPADGQSPVELVVRLFGRDGQPLKSAAFATIETSGGRVLLPGARTDELGPRRADADRALRGVQLKVESGLARFTLLAPAEAQDVRVRITAGAEEAAGTISFVPDLRPMVAAGLIEGIVSFRNKVGLQPVRRGDAFEREIQSWSRDFSNGRGTAAGRAAFYLKGTIRGDLLLTAAYDSDRDTRARLLRDVRPDELYPVYGDSSLRSFDARSTERLYVRLDKGKSYALFGDFVTGDGFTQPIGQGAVASLKQRSLGNYNRSATGVRLHHEQGALVGNVFAFRDTLKQVVEEFASQGSGPYGLSNNAVLEGSEKVEVLVRDRNQPSRIVEVRPLTRLVDYSFEPFSGRILLAAFLPRVDADLNPISLRVSYEVDQGGKEFWVVGGDAQWRITEGFELGGSLVQDRNPLARYELVSGNLTWRLGEKTALVLEGAQSTSTVNTNSLNRSTSPALAGRVGEVEGKAARAELVHEAERSDARVFWGRTSPLFNNPAAPLAGGREEWLIQGGFKLMPELKLYGHALKSEDRNAGGGSRRQEALGLRWNATERLTLDGSLRRHHETVGTQGNGPLTWPFDQTAGLNGSLSTGSGGGALGFGSQLLDPATGLPVIGQRGLNNGRSSLAAGTRLESTTLRLGAGYRLSDRVTLGGEIESDVSGDERRRAAVGADYLIAERTKLYGRYERQNGWVQMGGVSDTGRSAGAFALGVESSYLRDTQAFSEYRMRDAVSGRDLQLASGLRNQWDLAEGWRLNTGFEHVASIRGNTPATRAVTAALDWSANPLWRAGGRIEWRSSGDAPDTAENDRFDTTLIQALVARKLDRDWTLLARNHTLVTDYTSRGDVLQNRTQIGLAYRDTDTNRINALAKLEYKFENDASSTTAGELKTRAWVASTHADWKPVRPWWLTGRAAAKWQKDRFEGGTTSDFKAALLAGRLVWDYTENWDFSLLAATQFGQRGAREHAFGGEVGYLLRQNLWLSVGVNTTGFAGDADLVGYEYTRSGVYVRLRFKFDETLFKGSDREVNRSLPR
jgi:hypothetical protein